MSYDADKADLYYEVEKFLEHHPVSELLNIVADVIENEEEGE